MFLQNCFEAPGNWIVMRGVPTQWNQKPGQFGPYALGNLRDDQGAEVDCMFSGGKNHPLPNASLLNVSTIWAVKFDANTQKYKALFNGYSQGQAGPPVPPQPPQAAPGPQPPQVQRPRPPQPGRAEPDWEAIARGKIRNGLVLADRAAGMAWLDVLSSQNIRDHTEVVEYICTGGIANIPADEPDYANDQSPDDGPIPF